MKVVDRDSLSPDDRMPLDHVHFDVSEGCEKANVFAFILVGSGFPAQDAVEHCTGATVLTKLVVAHA